MDTKLELYINQVNFLKIPIKAFYYQGFKHYYTHIILRNQWKHFKSSNILLKNMMHSLVFKLSYNKNSDCHPHMIYLTEPINADQKWFLFQNVLNITSKTVLKDQNINLFTSILKVFICIVLRSFIMMKMEVMLSNISPWSVLTCEKVTMMKLKNHIY